MRPLYTDKLHKTIIVDKKQQQKKQTFISVKPSWGDVARCAELTLIYILRILSEQIMQKNYPLEGVLEFRCADFDKPRAGINFQSKAPFTSFFFFHFAFHLLEPFAPYCFLITIIVQVLQGGGISNENLSFSPQFLP